MRKFPILTTLLLLTGGVSAEQESETRVRVIRTLKGDFLNLREKPNVNSAIVVKVPYDGRGLFFLGDLADKNGAYIRKGHQDVTKNLLKPVRWMRVRYQKYEGWAWSDYTFPDADLPKPKGWDKESGLAFGIGYRFDKDKALGSGGDVDWTLLLNQDGSGSLRETEQDITIKWRFVDDKRLGRAIEVFEQVAGKGPDDSVLTGFPKAVSIKFHVTKAGLELREADAKGRIYLVEAFEY